MSKSLKKVVIMAGGTGGHVFPGLAVAHFLQAHGVEVHWIGTEKGLEAKLVPEAKLPLHLITIGGIRGKHLQTFLKAPFAIFRAMWQARAILRRIQPDIVLGMGGFVSGPGGLTSWLMGIPLIIHEQNAKPGFTNKLLSIFAHRVLEGFPGTFKSRKAVATGNPVRQEIEQLAQPEDRLREKDSPLRLLIIGGSLGAKALNEIIPTSLARLKEQERPLIYHQTGEKHFLSTEKAYAACGIKANLQPFIVQMADAYAWADMVICRAGALTVTELCSAGLGAIFVPFPFAVDDHQTANAEFMVKHQAALCLQEKDLTAASLAELIKGYIDDPDKCFRMAKAAYALRRSKVTERIFDILAETVAVT